VSGRDRPGLLYDVTNALSELSLNIGSAHVVTFGEKAADVFYVTDLNGGKITATGQIAAIKRKILQALVENTPKMLARRNGA
jgi:[protein-PII] uridylyltransferase